MLQTERVKALMMYGGFVVLHRVEQADKRNEGVARETQKETRRDAKFISR